MEATELMTGDWVLYRGQPHKVKEIYHGLICIEAQTGIDAVLGEFDAFLEDIQPIPLTQEILEKNGFKDCQFYGELLSEGGWQIICDCSRLGMRHGAGWMMDIPCKYVHELQHALRLCKIEKEIVL